MSHLRPVQAKAFPDLKNVKKLLFPEFNQGTGHYTACIFEQISQINPTGVSYPWLIGGAIFYVIGTP